MGLLILEAVAVLALAAVSFVVVTIYAWPANVAAARGIAAWWRSLPVKIRMLRDPAFRRRQETVDRYESVIGSFMIAHALRQRSADGDVMYEANRLVAAAYLERLTDEEVAVIAAHLNAELFEGKASEADLRAFLAEERTLAAASPQYLGDHVPRLIRRFRHLAPPEKGVEG